MHLFFVYICTNTKSFMQKKTMQKLLAITMFVFACMAFVMHLCNYGDFAELANMLFRTLLLIYLLLYMKVK